MSSWVDMICNEVSRKGLVFSGVANVLDTRLDSACATKVKECVQANYTTIPHQLSWHAQCKRPDGIHADAIVGETVKVTRQESAKLRELLGEGSFLAQCKLWGECM